MQDINRKLQVEIAFKLQFYNFLFTIYMFEHFYNNIPRSSIKYTGL
jgi:hypothetical protein